MYLFKNAFWWFPNIHYGDGNHHPLSMQNKNTCIPSKHMTSYRHEVILFMANRPKYTREYNCTNYIRPTIRIRKDSELANRITDFELSGEVSVNFLVNALLCDYFGIGLSHKKFCITHREQLWPIPENWPPDKYLNLGALPQTPQGGAPP